MFTIEPAQWNKVKLFWEKWHMYDMTVPIINLNIKHVYTEVNNILKYEKEKTLGFYHNDILLGLGQVLDKSIDNIKIAGIANMAVDPAYRTNGIGEKLMEIMQLYIQKNQFDLSILYSSMYASQFNFYEKFSYIAYPQENLMIKPFKQLDIPTEKYGELAKKIGKF